MATSRELKTTMDRKDGYHLSWSDNTVRGLCGAKTRATWLNAQFWELPLVNEESMKYCQACDKLGHHYLQEAGVRPKEKTG